MRGRVVAVVACVALVLLACGSEGGDDLTSSPSTTTPTAPLLDGTYELTGSQTCKSAQGPGSVEMPLFDGSSITVRGDRVTVVLRNEPVEAPVTIEATSFRVRQAFDGRGNPVDPNAPLALLLDLAGTSDDGGRTIKGRGSDAGVNCEYEFHGRHTDEAMPTQTAATAVADPCTTSQPEIWAKVDPAFGEVRVISACVSPWALANFANADTTLVHWNGSHWELGDRDEYCATASGPLPSAAPGEDDQAGRIRWSVCAPAAQPTSTTTTAPPSPASASGPCTRPAVQAAVPVPQTLVTDPTCSGGWAFAGALASPQSAPETEFVVLVQWDGSAWQVADRASACATGALPAAIAVICQPAD